MKKIKGKLNDFQISEEAVIILNNLSVACTQMNELDLSEKFLKEAIDISTKIPDFTDQGIK